MPTPSFLIGWRDKNALSSKLEMNTSSCIASEEPTIAWLASQREKKQKLLNYNRAFALVKMSPISQPAY